MEKGFVREGEEDLDLAVSTVHETSYSMTEQRVYFLLHRK